MYRLILNKSQKASLSWLLYYARSWLIKTGGESVEQKPVLEMRKITKIFPGVIALKDVSFSVNRSEVHCLVGQNGAGKSTLIKILAGAYRMDEGAVYLEGEPVHFSDPHSALQKGISVLYQELALNP